MELAVKVLVVQHHPDEGPGTLGDFLRDHGADLVFAHTWKDEIPPREPDGFDAVVSMGGPMNVYEEDKHPWLIQETRLLASAARAGLPVMGVCLGAQLIAKALGADVVQSPQKEMGWYEAKLTPAAAADPLWAGVEQAFPVVQWHGDMFQVPQGGELLATSEPCPHQAFGWKKAYGLQFHIEVTPAILEAWFVQEERLEDIVKAWDTLGGPMDSAAQTLYENFWKLMETP
jgi:GMP synthase (glutamine-hydrolysing)